MEGLLKSIDSQANKQSKEMKQMGSFKWQEDHHKVGGDGCSISAVSSYGETAYVVPRALVMTERHSVAGQEDLDSQTPLLSKDRRQPPLGEEEEQKYECMMFRSVDSIDD